MARHHLCRSPTIPRSRMASLAASGTGSRAQPGQVAGPRRRRRDESVADAAVGACRPYTTGAKKKKKLHVRMRGVDQDEGMGV